MKNLHVDITAVNIIEENHYYAYALKIAGISSKKLGDSFEGLLKNNNLYNDKELFDDGDLNWYDYGFRNYDPQIGRFAQLDPLTDETPTLSGYHYALNDPIGNIDEDGLAGVGIIGQLACWGGQSASMASMMSTLSAVGNVVGIAANILNIGSNVAGIVNNATLNTQINGQVSTEGVGDDQNKFVEFTKTIIDLDGGREAYSIDDEGSDFNLPNGRDGGIEKKTPKKWTLQKDNPNYYVSKTAAVKNKKIKEYSGDPNRYFDPEKDAYIALSPQLESIGLKKYSKAIIEVLDNKGNILKKVPVIVGDSGPIDQNPSALELSPEAARQINTPGRTPYKFDLPQNSTDPDIKQKVKRHDKQFGHPYKNKKYLDGDDGLHLKVIKVAILNPKTKKRCFINYYYWS